MSTSTTTLVPRPLLAVSDVPAASGWYQRALGLTSGHGGDEYEMMFSGRAFVLQLHALSEDHHHEPIGNPSLPLGNGVAVWFATEDFDTAEAALLATDPVVVTPTRLNPNWGTREVWVRDLDGYLVVLSEESQA